MKSILDPSFRYTPSVSTDLRKTFAKVRSERMEREMPRMQVLAKAGSNVLPIQKLAGGPAKAIFPDRH